MKPTLFVNGQFWPVNGNAGCSRVLAARDGRIEALGCQGDEAGEGEAWSRVIDLGGRVAIPGLVDAHCHLVSHGMAQTREADLRGVRSLSELRARLEAHARKLDLRPGTGRWLLGRGFEQDLLAEARWPDRAYLDEIAAEIPIRITRVCGHGLVANTAALALAGHPPTAASEGFPPGVFCESAMAPIYAAIPQPDAAEWLAAARWACREAARVGFTGIHSLMAHAREVRALVDLRREGPLPVRVLMQLPYAMLDHAAATGLRTGYGDDYLSVGAIKLFSDGSLGARTAALREPYTDQPSTSGELIYAPDELARRVRAVYEAGFQVCIHAIGDRAMDVTLDAIEAAPGPGGAPWAFPPRIEHASLVDETIIRRMRRLGVGAAVQPQFARSDYWSPDRLGQERARGCYAFRTLHAAGIPLAGSTDCPVELLDAMAALGQTVHRPDWSPEERLSLEDAVRIFSEGSYALRYRTPAEAPSHGRLAPGEYADFVVLEHDPRAVAPEDVEKIPIHMTVVGGRVVYPCDE